MTVYNEEKKYLPEAVESILNQTFTDFEFIIIDDASTDRTAEILDRYTDSRIIRFRNEKNVGPYISKNKGLAVARGEYIAIMDSDDISLPERFQKQVVYLSTHPEVGVLGTNVAVIDEIGNEDLETNYYFEIYTEPEVVKWHLLFMVPVQHPSVMMRKHALKSIRGYSDNLSYAADYDLYLRLSKITKIANLNEKLLLYRWHKSNMSKSKISLDELYNLNRLALKEFVEKSSLHIEVFSDNYLCENEEEYNYQFTRAVYPLYQGYVENTQLNDHQQALIRKDAARRIFNLANWKRKTPKFWPFFVFACWLDPAIVYYAGGLLLRRIFLIGQSYKKV